MLDNEVMSPRNDAFRAAYLKDYGQEMWDKRVKLLSEVTESYETYISKVRKELSTVQK